jgi:hypothetical protein
VELVDFKFILVSIYRSPHSDFCKFFNKLEILIYKVQLKGEKINCVQRLELKFFARQCTTPYIAKPIINIQLNKHCSVTNKACKEFCVINRRY